MMPDSGIPHCWVAVKVDTARGSIVGSAYSTEHEVEMGMTSPTSSLAKIT